MNLGGRINTENVFRDKELDCGFILRANEEVSKILREAINGENQPRDMSINLLDSTKRCFGFKLDQRLYLASLVDLPCIIEA
jgi:TATA-binding protein-associated factor Taf7